jgi:cytochrome P450
MAGGPEIIERWRDTYGDPFLIRAMNGELLTTGRPELIREIFTADPDDYLAFGHEILTPLVGADSLLIRSGPEHRRDRRLLGPPFLGSRMRSLGPMMVRATRRRIAALEAGDRFRALELTQSISLDVILEAAFGVEEPERLAIYHEAVLETMNALNPLFLFAKPLQRELFGRGPWARFQKVNRRTDALLQEQIDRVRPNAAERDDILSRMLTLEYEDGTTPSDAFIASQLKTFLAAGHETTGIALSWALERIHRTPGVLSRLRDEIAATGPELDPALVAELPYLEAVCQETLRLHPILSEVMRILAVDREIGGFEVPAGAGFCASISLAHMNPETFPDPRAFRPDRFLERKFTPFEYLPFGGGARRCLGASFALHELALALATILMELDLELLEPEPPVTHRRNVTLAPKGGVPMRVRERRKRLAMAD